MIPYTKHYIEQTDIDAVVTCLRSGQITQGARVTLFEHELALLAEAEEAVAFSSGTAALHAILWNLAAGDRRKEVITTPLTFAATANAILYAGLTPVFADVNPQTLCISPASVAAAANRNTIGVLAVDYAGQPCDMAELADVCRSRDMLLMLDACHSLGASYKGGAAGSHADFTAFSFHPAKAITTGEGGAVASAKVLPSMASIRRFRDHGRDSSGECIHLGYNYRMSEIHAALGLSQLNKLHSFVARRRSIANSYNAALAGTSGLELPHTAPQRQSAWHLYVVRVATDKREAFRNRLSEFGVETQIHYRLLWEHRRFRSFYSQCEAAEREASRLVSIPIFPAMTNAEVTKVIISVRQAAKEVL